MTDGINQSKSTVGRDQIGRDKVDINVIEVKKELAVARQAIAANNIVKLDDFISIEIDDDNTVLIQKLKKGGFNSQSRKNAKMQKLRTVSVIINLTKLENGKSLLTDVYANLMSIINTKYIVNLDEGESLKTDFSDILGDLSGIVNKYADIISIDEAFLEGLLYIATSNCALKWRMEEDTDEDADDCQ